MPRVPISIEARFLRIPVRWTVREPGPFTYVATGDSRATTFGEGVQALPAERILVPEVVQPIKPKLSTEDPGEWRNRFLRLKDEKSALEFLNDVGVWSAVEDDSILPDHASMGMGGSFGFRSFFGRALPMTLDEFWREQKYWNELLSDEKSLRERFGPPPPEDARPYDKDKFAGETRFLNDIPLHIEWRKGRPRGVIQPITFQEMLVTALHLDLLSDADFQFCQRPDCAISFTGRRRKYCQPYCGHIESVRRDRRPKPQRRKKKGGTK